MPGAAIGVARSLLVLLPVLFLASPAPARKLWEARIFVGPQ